MSTKLQQLAYDLATIKIASMFDKTAAPYDDKDPYKSNTSSRLMNFRNRVRSALPNASSQVKPISMNPYDPSNRGSAQQSRLSDLQNRSRQLLQNTANRSQQVQPRPAQQPRPIQQPRPAQQPRPSSTNRRQQQPVQPPRPSTLQEPPIPQRNMQMANVGMPEIMPQNLPNTMAVQSPEGNFSNPQSNTFADYFRNNGPLTNEQLSPQPLRHTMQEPSSQMNMQTANTSMPEMMPSDTINVSPLQSPRWSDTTATLPPIEYNPNNPGYTPAPVAAPITYPWWQDTTETLPPIEYNANNPGYTPAPVAAPINYQDNTRSLYNSIRDSLGNMADSVMGNRIVNDVMGRLRDYNPQNNYTTPEFAQQYLDKISPSVRSANENDYISSLRDRTINRGTFDDEFFSKHVPDLIPVSRDEAYAKETVPYGDLNSMSIEDAQKANSFDNLFRNFVRPNYAGYSSSDRSVTIPSNIEGWYAPWPLRSEVTTYDDNVYPPTPVLRGWNGFDVNAAENAMNVGAELAGAPPLPTTTTGGIRSAYGVEDHNDWLEDQLIDKGLDETGGYYAPKGTVNWAPREETSPAQPVAEAQPEPLPSGNQEASNYFDNLAYA